jgi:hypothetical protein
MPFCFHAQKSFGSGCEVCNAWMMFTHCDYTVRNFFHDLLYVAVCFSMLLFVISPSLDCSFYIVHLCFKETTTVIVTMHWSYMYCFRVVFGMYIQQLQKLWFAPFSVFTLQQWFIIHGLWESCACITHLIVVFQINQPTRCKNFSSLLLDVHVQLNMFQASSRLSSEAQQLQ